MAFGPIMRFTSKSDLSIELAPLARDGMHLFIKSGGVQGYEVIKFLGPTTAAVLEDDYSWFEKVRSNSTDLIWGIYVLD